MNSLKKLQEALDVLDMKYERNPSHYSVRVQVGKVLDIYQDCKHNTCSACEQISDDVHECMNCDVRLCINCDKNEMPLGADDHTYCTPCVKKLFYGTDYERILLGGES